MNHRYIVITCALIFPIIAVVTLNYFNPPKSVQASPLSQSMPDISVASKPVNATNTPTPPPLNAVRARVQARLDSTMAMNDAQYADVRKHFPYLPPTLAQQRIALKTRLDHLNSITPAQWEEENKHPPQPAK